MQTDGMIALAALVFGIALAGLTVFARALENWQARAYLILTTALFAGLSSLPLVVAFAPPLYVYYLPLMLPMLLALPVAVHRYARALTAEVKTSNSGIRDGILPFAGLLTACGYLVLPNRQKITLFVDGELPPGLFTSVLVFATLGLILVWSLASFGYLAATVSQLRVYRDHLKAIYSNTEQYELRWIDRLLWLLVLLWAAAAFSIVSDNIGPRPTIQPELVTTLLAFVLLTLIAFSVPSQSSANEASDEEEAEPPEAPPATEKYIRSALTPERADLIAKRLEAAMQKDRLYLDPNLSLQKLSRSIGTPANLLSQALNEKLGQTFFDYIAHWRIEAAKPLIKKGDAGVLEIALEVGFNSRSTFYKAFKRETGLTPKEFRTIAA